LPSSACCDGEDREYNRVRETVRLTLKNPREIGLPDGDSCLCPLEKIDPRKNIFDHKSQSETDAAKYGTQQRASELNEIPAGIKTEEVDESRLEKLGYLDHRETADKVETDGNCELDGSCATESVHDYLCHQLRRGCQSASDCNCVPLGSLVVRRDNEQSCPEIDVDPCKYRRLIYTNHLLSDLVDCYHGDLPRIVDYNWREAEFPGGGQLEVGDFQRFVERGPVVVFNQEMDVRTIHQHSFLFSVTVQDDNTAYLVKRYVPAKEIVLVNPDEIDGCFGVRFIVDTEWIADTFAGRSGIKSHGGSAELVLRGSLIRSRRGKRLDGDDNGTQAGDFVSCIDIGSRRSAT